MNKKRLFFVFAVTIIVLLPSTVFASTIIQQTYGIKTEPTANPFILAGGPNYAVANQLGFATISECRNRISFGYVNNSLVELINVAEIVNNTNLKNNNMYVDLSLSSSAYSNITVYYRSTPVPLQDIFPTLAQLGTAINTTGSGIIEPATLVIGDNTTSSASTWYLSVVLTGNVQSAILTLSYYIK